MNTKIYSETDLKDHNQPLDKGLVMIHFKLVGIGEQTQESAGYLPSKICELANKQKGFFLISQGGTGLREGMHNLVDRFCNLQEGKDESTN